MTSATTILREEHHAILEMLGSLEAIVQRIDPRKLWAGAARGYSTLLRNHIWKENEILFQIAERILSPEEQTALAKQFAEMQREKLDPETEARLLHTKQKMAREFAAVAK